VLYGNSATEISARSAAYTVSHGDVKPSVVENPGPGCIFAKLFFTASRPRTSRGRDLPAFGIVLFDDEVD